MIIGRRTEQKELIEAYKSEYSEFVAITGRRRVGKTFLVRETFDYKFAFEHSGLANQSTRNQLREFKTSLVNFGAKVKGNPSNWFEAFTWLADMLRSQPEGKKVVFIDELPWMDAPHSNFVSAVEHFWNAFASARKDILLIVCGSATSWIIKKVFRDHGGLHNRVTHRLHLAPFTLYECEQFAKSRSITESRQSILEYYMAMGGIPYYWSLLQRGMSVAQNLDRLFFNTMGTLRHEYSNLYHSLFKHPDPYIKVIEALSTKKIGLSRQEIIAECQLNNNGMLSRILDDLETCGFIRKYEMRGIKRGLAVFQLIDNYTLFYFKFIKGKSRVDEDFWSMNVNSPTVFVWEGLAFEKVCFLHYRQIKMALGISGVSTEYFSWQVKGDEVNDGAQIDMVIDRADKTANLCEIKYSNSEFMIDKAMDKNLRNKMERYRQTEKGRRNLLLTLISPYGLKENMYSSIIQNVITLDDLFAE